MIIFQKKTSLYVETIIGFSIILAVSLFLAYLEEWIGFVVLLLCGLVPTIALFYFTMIIIDKNGIRKFCSQNTVINYTDIGSVIITTAPLMGKQISITTKSDCLLQSELAKNKDFKTLSKVKQFDFSYSDKCFELLLDNLGIAYDELFVDLNKLVYSTEYRNDYRIDILLSFGKPCVRIFHKDILDILEQC